ncbi:MAG: hypothetical protein PHF97_09310 [Bacteroidales bacterium]|nr:hypothetical protein [Bacteroidales bacterium]MDD4603988.1 hypothetical protein [Bacteroidales bacterium]
MKSLNLISLYKAEIKKNMLAQIKGGTDIHCICGHNNPFVSMKTQGGATLCACSDSATSSTVQNRPEK